MDTSGEAFQFHPEENFEEDASRGEDLRPMTVKPEAGMSAESAAMPDDMGCIPAVGSIDNAKSNSNISKRDESSDRAPRERRRPPANFCRDYLFYTCDRKDCKFKHPSKGSQEYKDALATRPGWESREKNERSRSPRRSTNRSRSRADDKEDSRGDKSATICKDFLRSNCYRGKDCRYSHPPYGNKQDLPWPQLCLDYRSGNCKRTNCRFLHFSTEDEEYYMRTGSVRRQLWQHFADIVLKENTLLKGQPVCTNFLHYGTCSMKVCQYRHLSQDQFDDEIYSMMAQMVYEKCKRIHRDAPPPMDRRGGDAGYLPPPIAPHPYRGSYERDYQSPSYPLANPYSRTDESGGVAMLRLELDDLKRENVELRQMMKEDTARAQSDVETLRNENIRLQEDLSFIKDGNQGGQLLGKMRQENTDLSDKLRAANEWLSNVQGKHRLLENQFADLNKKLKTVSDENAKINDEKMKLQRRCDNLVKKEGAGDVLNTQKKVYLENKIKQFYETMKRCDTEFTETLKSTFHIDIPQVMAYFPTWGFLMSDVNEIAVQIDTTAPKKTTAPPPPPNTYNNNAYGAVPSAPPPATNSNYGAAPGFFPRANAGQSNNAGYYGGGDYRPPGGGAGSAQWGGGGRM